MECPLLNKLTPFEQFDQSLRDAFLCKHSVSTRSSMAPFIHWRYESSLLRYILTHHYAVDCLNPTGLHATLTIASVTCSNKNGVKKTIWSLKKQVVGNGGVAPKLFTRPSFRLSRFLLFSGLGNVLFRFHVVRFRFRFCFQNAILIYYSTTPRFPILVQGHGRGMGSSGWPTGFSWIFFLFLFFPFSSLRLPLPAFWLKFRSSFLLRPKWHCYGAVSNALQINWFH